MVVASSSDSKPQLLPQILFLYVSRSKYSRQKEKRVFQGLGMDPEAARTARESLELAFSMSNILDTGLDRHTLSVLIALCDLGLNPEALAAVIKELRRETPPSPTMGTTPSVT